MRGVARIEPELGALALADGERAVGPLENGLPGVDGEVARRAVTVDAVAACALQHEPAFFSLHIDLTGVGEIAHACGDAATVELQRDGVVVELHHFEFGRSIEPHDGRTDLQLGTGAGVGGQAVTAGERPVAVGADPLGTVGAVEPDLAIQLGHPRDPARRVGIGPGLGVGAEGQRKAGSGSDEKRAHRAEESSRFERHGAELL